MDNWNRNDQDVYTGINAQRRNRRRTGRTAETPEKPAAPETPVDRRAYMRPETPAEPEQFKAPAAPETPVKSAAPETPADRRAYMRPETPAEPERFTALDDMPETPVKPAETEEPAAPAVPEESGTIPEAETQEKPAETEEPGKPAENGEAEEPAAAGKPDVPAEPEIAVQGADSRIPPEARRMAASPYGTVGSGVRHVGTRRETGTERPVRNDERRTRVQPRRETPAGIPGEPARRPQRARVQVGYEPGRMNEMNEELTRQVPVADTVRQPVSNANAKAYLEKRSNPFRNEEGGNKIPDRPENKKLRAAVALIVAAGLLLTGWMLFKGRNGKDPVISREAPQVISFEPPDTEGLIGPKDLIFSVATEKAVDGIRLRAENGEDLDTVTTFGDNADGRLWMMKMHVETGFHGTVILQARRGEAEGWIDTAYTAEVNVNSPLNAETAKNRETGTEAEEDNDDYYNEDEEMNTEAPAEALTEGQEDPETKASAETPDGQPGEDAPAGEPEGEPEEGTEGDGDELPAGELKTPAPTNTPAPEEPKATTTPPLTAEAAPEAAPDLITGITVYTSFTKKVKDYSRPAKELIHMPVADEYTTKRLGVMTFRGDNFRRNAAAGELSAEPVSLQVLWKTDSGSSRGTNQTYYGYEWTGQPVIARWSTEVRTHSNITEAKIEKSALKEVIIAGMDGWIRFLDLEDGKITRNSIKLGYPMKGTPSLHTRGYPFLSVGQFARKMRGRTGRIGLRQYNLYTQNELKLIDGLDGKYHRPLNDIGSFETSALIDRESDTLIAVGTNGMLYLEALNSSFDYNMGVLSISQSTTTMTSKVKGQKNKALLAVESSPAAYDKYVYYADMGGVLRCIDTNTLQPVWAVNTGDSVMAAIAMDLTEARQLNLYTANMLNNRKKGNSDIQIRRYDAMSGKESWCTEIGVYKGKKDKDDVGAKASPVIGQNALKDLVYFTVTGLSDDGRAKLGLKNEEQAALIALDKETGKVVWKFGLPSRSESSPIALYDEAGNGWILQCEQDGIVHLLDGLTGTETGNLDLEAEIKASPAAYNNVVVIGTTGKDTSFIYGIEIKLAGAPEKTAAPQDETGGAADEADAEQEDGAQDEDDGWDEAEDMDEESGEGYEEDSGGA